MFYFRSLKGKDPKEEEWLYNKIEDLEAESNKRGVPTRTTGGSWINLTICTLYKSCSEIYLEDGDLKKAKYYADKYIDLEPNDDNFKKSFNTI